MQDASPRQDAAWYPYAVLAASLYMMVAGTGSIYVLVAALKPIAEEFDWPRSVPSTAYALQYVGGGVGGILMGYWLDRGGMAKPACVGGVMIGCGAMLTYAIESAWQLYLIYGLMIGLAGRATLFSPLMINITHWFEDRRGMAVGVVGSGQAMAGAIWPRIFQEGIAAFGWRETTLLYGAFILVTMVPLSLVFLRDSPRPPRPSTTPSASGAPAPAAVVYPIAARTLTVLLSVAIIGCCVAMSLPLAHLLSYASDVGFTPTHGAQLLSVMLICAAISSMFGVGALSSRYGGLGALFAFSGIQALTLGLFPLADTLPELYVVAALFGLGYGGVLPTYPVIIRELIAREGAGARTGVVVFFGTVGMAIGSWLGGFMFDVAGSYGPAFYIGVVFNFGNLAIIAYLIKRVRTGRRGLLASALATSRA